MNYFGTDGIRGIFGSQLTEDTAYRLGCVLGMGDNPIVLISRDTRLSGNSLLDACTQGVYSSGGSVINLGILPTNAVAHFVRKLGGDYGIMISASHNAPEYNGMKVFDRYGSKISSDMQGTISNAMSLVDSTYVPPRESEPVFYDIDSMYCHDMHSLVGADLRGMNIALDCAYGASYKVAPMLLGMCGAKTVCYCNRPLGNNINTNCGATHIDTLREHMLTNNCQLGFAMDGDSDRIAVLEGTTEVDSSAVLLCIARYMSEQGTLRGGAVAGTTLTNSGVQQALRELGISLLRSQVGDSNMAQLMADKGLNVGAESSGHYILTDYGTTSDSLIVAMLLAKIYRSKGSLLAYSSSYKPVTSMSIDIDISKVAEAFSTGRELAMLASSINNNYHNSRVVLRPSGTEPKVRCYIEGDNCQEIAQLIATTIASR